MNAIRGFSIRILNKIEAYTKIDTRYLLKGGFWLVSPSVIGSVLSLLLSILIAKYVSKEVFGIYKYILSMAGIAVAFSLTGMNTAVTQAVAQGKDGIFLRSIPIQAKWSLPQFLFLLSLATYYFVLDNTAYAVAFLIMAIAAPLTTILNTYSSYLAGKKDFQRTGIYSFWTNFIYFSAMSCAVVYFPSIIVLVTVYYVSNLIGNLYFFYKTIKIYKPTSKLPIEDIRYGKHLSLMNMFGIVATQIDNIIVYHFLGPVELAIYNFSLIIPERLRSLFGFIPTIALPRLAERNSQQKKINLKNAYYLIILALFISALYIFFAPFIFVTFFPEYMAAVPYTKVATFVLIAIATSYIVTAFTAQKLQKDLYTISIGTPIIRIVLVVLFIYYLGIWGAIYARILSHFIQLLLTIYLNSRKFN